MKIYLKFNLELNLNDFLLITIVLLPTLLHSILSKLTFSLNVLQGALKLVDPNLFSFMYVYLILSLISPLTQIKLLSQLYFYLATDLPRLNYLVNLHSLIYLTEI